MNVDESQGQMIIIKRFETQDQLQKKKQQLLDEWNTGSIPTNSSLSLRVLSKNRLQIILLGELEILKRFIEKVE